MTDRIKTRAQRGFTLLEMLVAIMVFGLLVSMVYGMLRIGSRGWEAGGERIEETDAMRIGWTFVQRALNNARAVESLKEDGEGVHFIGTEQALEFVADMPAYLGSGGLHVVSLSVEDAELDPEREGPARRLVLRRVPLLDYGTESGEQLQQSAVLVDQLDSVKMAYYGEQQDARAARGPDQPAEWHYEWAESPSLPVLVQIAVQPYAGTPWPILIAHPQLGRDRKASSDTDPLSDYAGGEAQDDGGEEPLPPETPGGDRE